MISLVVVFATLAGAGNPALVSGARAWKAGEIDEARRALGRAAEEKAAQAHLLLANLEGIEGNLDAALGHCKAFLELEPKSKDAGSVKELAARLQREKDAKLPEEERKRLRYDALLTELRDAKASRNADGAMRLFGHARSIAPERWEAPALAGAVLLEDSRFHDAKVALDHAASRAPAAQRSALDEALTLCGREISYRDSLRAGLSAYAKGELPAAAEALERATAVHPEAPEGVDEAVAALSSTGDWGRAWAVAKRHRDAAPPDRRALQASELRHVERMASLHENALSAKAPADDGPEFGDLSNGTSRFEAEMQEADREAARAEQEAIARGKRLRAEIEKLEQQANALEEEIAALPGQAAEKDYQADETEKMARDMASKRKSGDVFGGLVAVGTATGSVALREEARKLRDRIGEAQRELSNIREKIAGKREELGDGAVGAAGEEE